MKRLLDQIRYGMVYVTVKDEKEAKKIGKALLKDKLVACINYFPIKSLYSWKGKIESSKELGMFLKTKKKLIGKVIERVKELHSYEVPGIVSLSLKKGNKEFFAWMGKEVREK